MRHLCKNIIIIRDNKTRENLLSLILEQDNLDGPCVAWRGLPSGEERRWDRNMRIRNGSSHNGLAPASLDGPPRISVGDMSGRMIWLEVVMCKELHHVLGLEMSVSP